MSCPKLKYNDFHKNCLQVTPLTGDINNDKSKITKRTALEGKETVKIITNEGIQELVVPSKNTNYYPIKIKDEEMNRLRANALVVTEKENLKMIESESGQIRLEHECAARKLSALEKEARDKANYLLKKAWELRQEDEDDVKYMNSLILQAKCQAIRDAQLLEHKLIERELKEENKRLEQMMEDNRTRELMLEKKKLDEEKARKQRYVQELNEQVEDLEAHRLLNAELMIEEQKKNNEAMFAIMLEEFENLKKKDEEKRQLRECLNMANEQMKKTKALEKEEERLQDLKIKEYMRLKAEREEKFEKEKEQIKRAKEFEYTRQTGRQMQAEDLQAQQDAINAIRRHEEYEREWRKREKEAALKRRKMEEDCKLARDKQIIENRRFKAMEIVREKREFEKNVRIQMELQEKERLLEIKKKYDLEKYREEILRQINEKEKERIDERKEKFQEGVALKAEEAKRKHDLKQIFQKKMENVKQNRLPEVYVAQIERKLNLL
ncbi:gamma-taxilin, putative [Pediculus humanus corporis]|uniref:Cilia- and flagella-associated protein 45 n=1 Tax=Pediculus humanus subsp. corporis TaxID=121224 RepID=E0VGE4_PEDHC|nr:gamma-taxilin, putative [Pediculus humanus corporis]EEB12450.1 gamma-taxilin, putative [Pediculus humanus corporis]